MKTYVVCEGLNDVQLLKRILPSELTKNVEIVAGGGLYALKSLALSLIVRRQSPVVIVIDSDSDIVERVQQQVQDTEELLSSLAVHTPVKVIPAIPALEIVLFKDIALLTRLLGYMPNPDLLSQAIDQPKQVLDQLISQSQNLKDQAQLLDNLTEQDVEILRETTVIQELIRFLKSVQVADEVLQQSL
ncbi:MAG: hypothetical protein BJG00_013840 [Limnothrix sp. CACIAM 69d]|nr:MAG: hypothetical protein BJG00_013840 [Limnothrix sp. CACIAM 69d]